ncbi:probable beta-1,3-galactosyltransferase 12 isoform X2 [Cryptomeria japonica]|uniref:probable beta-1,3-galactosyltransferase 12 isoform X2 n=1 Tax=Cryptomeria japonica TaxID=3369 RepID=UPI0025AD8AB0|nr:probable beta-1,3-galactosyltransferase 12 isoform X2 [Cryptomeria japonica]
MKMASKFLPLWQNGKHKSRFQQKSCGPLFSIFCLCVGIIGTSFGVFALIRGRPVYKFRCGNAEDTLRSLHLGGANARYLGWPGGLSQLEEETRHKVLGVVGIQTGFASSERRKALRETWLPSDPDGLISLEQATGLAFRFVIGRSKNVQEMAELEKEIEKYKDFMLIDVEEEYLKLPYKTLAFFKAAYALFDADFYVKADDDIYLRPDRLATLLAKERPSPRTYIGCMKKGPVITDPKLKWYEPLGYLLGGEYFYHAYGPIYALSSEVVAGLAVARNDSFRMFSNEDVTIGSWMLAMNVNHEDNRAICDSRCKSNSIAVWDIPKCSGLCNPVEKLRKLHKIDMCSKSPTLPSDE